jgi:hypothetical protein
VLLILLAVLIVLGALCWLGVVLVRTWKHIAAVGRGIAAAGDQINRANDDLQRVSNTSGHA